MLFTDRMYRYVTHARPWVSGVSPAFSPPRSRLLWRLATSTTGAPAMLHGHNERPRGPSLAPGPTSGRCSECWDVWFSELVLRAKWVQPSAGCRSGMPGGRGERALIWTGLIFSHRSFLMAFMMFISPEFGISFSLLHPVWSLVDLNTHTGAGLHP